MTPNGNDGDEGPPRQRTPPLGRPSDALASSVERAHRGVERTWRSLRTATSFGEPESFPEVPVAEPDAAGRAITYRPLRPSDREDLVGMYDAFDPADRAQGTPPVGEDAIREWLDDVLAGVNVVAVHDAHVVGHAMFVPDGTDRHEFAIFVDRAYRGAGVGTTLARAGLGHARERGVDYVWLSVSADERGLQRWYRRLGFRTVNPMGIAHRMSRRL